MTEARGRWLGGPTAALVAIMVAVVVTATSSDRVQSQSSGQPRVLGVHRQRYAERPHYGGK
jgi:hypothetical protein